MCEGEEVVDPLDILFFNIMISSCLLHRIQLTVGQLRTAGWVPSAWVPSDWVVISFEINWTDKLTN